jgi:hypothetical protein
MGGRAPADQLLAMLKSAGVRDQEIAETGFGDWVRAARGPVERADAQEFLRANRLRVKEQVMGDVARLENKSMWLLTPDEAGRQSWVTNIGRASMEIIEEKPNSFRLTMSTTRRGVIRDTVLPTFEAAAREARRAASDLGIETKYGQYTLPGGAGYRELLFIVPPKSTPKPSAAVLEGRRLIFAEYTDRLNELNARVTRGGPEAWKAARDRDRLEVERDARADREAGPIPETPKAEPYRSSHWDVDNPLAHVRFNERVDADGRRVLFIEEIQSDWHQAGRQRGYKGVEVALPADIQAVIKEIRAIGIGVPVGEISPDTIKRAGGSSDLQSRWQKIIRDRYNEIPNEHAKVPDAPLKGEAWKRFALRRMMRWAAENGFDRVAWTTGEQQATRYNLTEHVETIDWRRGNRPDGARGVEVSTKRGSRITAEIDAEGMVAHTNDPRLRGKSLDEVLGKSIAQQIMRRDDGTLSGDGLKIGGEGMRGFYDRELVNIANDIARPHGARVGEAAVRLVEPKTFEEFAEQHRRAYPEATPAETEAAFKRNQEVMRADERVHAIDVTPKMREAAMAGQPMYSIRERSVKAGDLPIGAKFRLPNGREAEVTERRGPVIVYRSNKKTAGIQAATEVRPIEDRQASLFGDFRDKPAAEADTTSFAEMPGEQLGFKFAVRDREIEQSALLGRVKSQIVEEPPKEPERTKLGRWDRIRTAIFDDLIPLKRFEEQVAGKLPADQSPYTLARVLRAMSGAGDVFIDAGPVDHDTLRVRTDVKSLRDAVAPVVDRMPDFESYLLMRRAAELAESPVERLAASGQALLRQFGDVVDGKRQPVTIDEMRGEISRIERVAPEFKGAAHDVYAWNDAVIDYLEASGRYSSSAISALRDLHKNYVPLHRLTLDEAELLRDPKTALRSPLARLEGSEAPIVSPVATLMRNMYAMVKAAHHNDMMVAIADLAERGAEKGWMTRIAPKMEAVKFPIREIRDALGASGADLSDADLSIIATLFRPAAGGVKNEIAIHRGGETQYWRVDPGIFKALQSLDPAEMPLWLKALSLPKNVFRAGITLAPSFQVANVVRDAFASSIQGKGFPFDNYARGLFEMTGRSDLYNRWRSSGGQMFSIMASDASGVERRLRRMTVGGRISELGESIKAINPRDPRELAAGMARIAQDVMGALGEISEISESPTRIGVFRRSLEAPSEIDLASRRPDRATALRAALESREASTDFLRRGAAMQAMNQAVAFLNPAIQGTDKLVRTIIENPGKVSAVAASMIAAEYLLYMNNKDKEGYDAVPQWVRDTSWVYVTDAGESVVVPGPFEWKVLFGALPRRIFEWMNDEDPDILDSLFKTTYRGFHMNLWPTAVTPLIENKFNYSIFRDRPIVPRSIENAEPGEQYTERTSQLARRIGAAFDYAPVKIDNLIKGYTGTLGSEAARALDALLSDDSFGEKPSSVAADYPIISRFLRRSPTTSAESVERFFDYLGRARTARATRKRLEENGRLTPEWDAENAWALAIATAFERSSKRFSALRRAAVEVEHDATLSGEQKREQLDEIASTMQAEARRMVDGANELRRGLPSPTIEAAGAPRAASKPAGQPAARRSRQFAPEPYVLPPIGRPAGAIAREQILRAVRQ